MAKHLLSQAKTVKPRTLLLFGGIICVLAGLSVAFIGRGANVLQTQESASAKVPQITAIPGSVTSEKYRSLQEEDNQRRAQAAQKTGGSAIATIIGTRSKDALEKQQTLGIEDQFGTCPACTACTQKEDETATPLSCPVDTNAAMDAASDNKSAALKLLNDCPTLAEAFAAKNPALFKELLLENPVLARKIARVDPTFMKKLLLSDPVFAKQLSLSNPEVLKTLLASDPSFAEAFSEKNPALFKQLLLDNPDLAKQLAQLNPAFMKKLFSTDPVFSKQITLSNPESVRMVNERTSAEALTALGNRDQDRALSIETMRRKQQEARTQAARQAQLNEQQQKQLALLMATMESASKKVVKNLEEVSHQQFVQGEQPKNKDAANTSDGQANNTKDAPTNKSVLIKAGTILYASLDTAVNSDEPGPIMGTIVQGDFKGAKVIGALQPAPSTDNRPEKVILSFTTMSPVDTEKSLKIKAVAVDPDSARTALASNVDHHYLLRYGTLLASSFATGYAKVISSQGSSTNTNTAAGVTTTTMPSLSANQQIFAALGQVGQNVGTATSSYFNTPNTITVDQGTGFGLLVLDDVSET
jgi:type IV secretory pathway VirB10-like protein